MRAGRVLGKRGIGTGESGVAFHFPLQSMTLNGLPGGLGLLGRQRAGDATRCLLRRDSLSQRNKFQHFGNPGESDLIAPSRTLKMIWKALSPRPGLEMLMAGVTHNWRYGLLSDAAPQLGTKAGGWPLSQNKKCKTNPTGKTCLHPMIPMEKSGNADFENSKTNPLKPLVILWPAIETPVNTVIHDVFWDWLRFLAREIQWNQTLNNLRYAI